MHVQQGTANRKFSMAIQKNNQQEGFKMTEKMQKKSFLPMQYRQLMIISLVSVIALMGAAAPTAIRAQEGEEEIQFADADLFLELNNTDGDLGLHASIDGDAWKHLMIKDPEGRKILNIRAGGKLRKHGLTQLDFESAEPPFDELDPGVFFRRFPEGEYEVEGRTVEGQEMESTAKLTHVLPGPPQNIAVNGQKLPDGCDRPPVLDLGAPLVITWDEVTESHPELGRTGEPVEPVSYQVVLEQLDFGLSFSAVLPPEVTDIIIPETVSQYASGSFKLEILVKEESGNQTAREVCFDIE
jgi:hypothetical protein